MERNLQLSAVLYLVQIHSGFKSLISYAVLTSDSLQLFFLWVRLILQTPTGDDVHTARNKLNYVRRQLQTAFLDTVDEALANFSYACLINTWRATPSDQCAV